MLEQYTLFPPEPSVAASGSAPRKTAVSCEACGVTFLRKPSAVGKRVFCSQACRKQRTAVACGTCHKAMVVRPSEAGGNRFCSAECLRVWRLNGQQVSCANCSASLWRSQARMREVNFCDHKCRGEWHRRTRVVSSCIRCGKTRMIPPSVADARMYCGNRCKDMARIRQIEVACAWCGTMSTRIPSRYVGARGSFCNSACWYAWRRANEGPDPYRVLRRRIRRMIGGRIRVAIKLAKGRRATESLLGYTIAELMSHLESKFQPGMTWENWAVDGWHIDHVRPVSSFSISSLDDPSLRECWALSNLQPLWAHDNLKKRAKWVDVSQDSA